MYGSQKKKKKEGGGGREWGRGNWVKGRRWLTGKGLVVVKPVKRGIVWGGASVCVGAVGALRVACVGACGGARQQGVAKLLRDARAAEGPRAHVPTRPERTRPTAYLRHTRAKGDGK